MDKIENELVIPYTMVPNEVLQNPELSLKQKGMLCYLISLPKGWKIYKSELESRFTDGRESISNAIEDLVKLGFLGKTENPKEQGKFSGFTYTVKPLRVNRNGSTATENPQLINTNKEITNKEKNIINNILLSKIKISDLPQDKNSLMYFDIATKFVSAFMANKIYLGDKNVKNLEEAKYKAYVDPIRLLIETDKYTKEELRIVYNFLCGPKSDFWKPNILSTSKLREKFSKLLIEAKKVTAAPKEVQSVYVPVSNKIDHSNRV